MCLERSSVVSVHQECLEMVQAVKVCTENVILTITDPLQILMIALPTLVITGLPVWTCQLQDEDTPVAHAPRP